MKVWIELPPDAEALDLYHALADAENAGLEVAGWVGTLTDWERITAIQERAWRGHQQGGSILLRAREGPAERSLLGYPVLLRK